MQSSYFNSLQNIEVTVIKNQHSGFSSERSEANEGALCGSCAELGVTLESVTQQLPDEEPGSAEVDEESGIKRGW